MNRGLSLVIACALALVGFSKSQCDAGYGASMPVDSCSTAWNIICPSMICSDFNITCAQTNIWRGSFDLNEHVRVIIAPARATSVTIQFTESGMDDTPERWQGVLIYECLSLDDCSKRCATQVDCESNLRQIGNQSGWNYPDLKTFTSSTGAVILYWSVPSSGWKMSGFKAAITAQPDSIGCSPCPPGEYKANYGSSACDLCPPLTYSSTGGSSTCHDCELCTERGFYRTGCGKDEAGVCVGCSKINV
jgi:hypothetical protein